MTDGLPTDGAAERGGGVGEVMQGREVRALAPGRKAILDDVHLGTGAYVEELHPWDGRDDEPAEWVSAYLTVLPQRIELERGEQAFECRPRRW